MIEDSAHSTLNQLRERLCASCTRCLWTELRRIKWSGGTICYISKKNYFFPQSNTIFVFDCQTQKKQICTLCLSYSKTTLGTCN